MKKRIENLEASKDTEFIGWQFEGGEAVINKEKNRLQLLFDENPSEEPVNGVNRQKTSTQTVKTREYVNKSSDKTINPKTVNEARRDFVQKKVKDKKAEEKREVEKASQEHTSAPKSKENYQYDFDNETPELKAKDTYNPHSKITTSSGTEKVDLTSGIKTKENYMKSLRQERFEVDKSPYSSTPKPNQKTQTVSRSTANAKKAVKTRQATARNTKDVVKSGSVYTSKTAKRWHRYAAFRYKSL